MIILHIRNKKSQFNYCLHVEIIHAKMGVRKVQDYYNIGFFMYYFQAVYV